MVLKAADAAARWHVDQRRKGAAKEPYINDLLEVATLVAEATGGGIRIWLSPLCFTTPLKISKCHMNSFGKDGADLVAEVTDDKTLPKAERKRLQEETAQEKSHRAKVLKLADKISNLRSLVSSPAQDWSVERKREYINFCCRVVKGLRGTNAMLEKLFDEAARAAEQSLVPAL
jgi:GTP diphosphokinase / guanosine-3',5'-bis(diphosphate) 3'-diphosphatase